MSLDYKEYIVKCSTFFMEIVRMNSYIRSSTMSLTTLILCQIVLKYMF
jgi:hypothetical protein